MSFTLLRQFLALGIITFSYKYIKEKNFIKFLIIIIIASLFHKTALIFIIAYPIFNKVKFGIKNYFIIFFALFLSIIVGQRMLYWIVNVLKDERFYMYLERESSLNLTNFFINFAILIFCDTLCKLSNRKMSNMSFEINGLMNLQSISCVFLAFTPVLGEMYRIAMYFCIFNILLVPNLIESININKNGKRVVYICLYVCFIIYYFLFSLKNAQVIPYIFYFKGV